MNNQALPLILAITITTVLFTFSSLSNPNSIDENSNVYGETVSIFMSRYCGCCHAHAYYLDQNGYKVEIVYRTDMESIKTEYGIPQHLVSCHTTIIDEYVIEGHMPIEAIDKLLDEKPEIQGIALPGMPSGSPGMPGRKLEPFIIHSITLEGKDGGIYMEL
jgi:hypothetical protein